ncbi:hypothetical protein SprV_0100089700 [Sparganum proliferum]
MASLLENTKEMCDRPFAAGVAAEDVKGSTHQIAANVSTTVLKSFHKSCEMHKCESVSSQIIVKQQLEAHYKRLQSVKRRPSNTDNRNLPTPVRPYASDSFVDGIIQRMLTDDGFISEQSPQWLKITSSRQRSADRHGRNNAPRSRTESNRSCSSARCRVVREQPADVFERRPQKFTPAKAFTPRTLRSSATSFIRNLECYNPPIKRRSTRSSPRASPVHEQEKSLGTRSVSVPKNSANSARKHDRAVPVPKKRSSCSVACQASECCPSDTISAYVGPDVGQSAELALEKSQRLALVTADQVRHSEPETMEEELEFLNFLSTVTSDILRRSSYTNEQICVIFRRHLADRSSVLPPTLKRRALHQIVQQLNLPPAVAMVIGESSRMGDRISSETGSCVDHASRLSPQSSRMAPNSMMVNVSQTEERDVTATLKTTSSPEQKRTARNLEGMLSSAMQAASLGESQLGQDINDAEVLDCDYLCRPLKSRPRSGDLLSDRWDEKAASHTTEHTDLSTPLTEVTTLNCEVSESSPLAGEVPDCTEASRETVLEPGAENYEDDFFGEKNRR